MRKYFSEFGEVKYLRLVLGKGKNDSRGYGFLQVDSHDGTEAILAKKKHKIKGTTYTCTIYVKSQKENSNQERKFSENDHEQVYPDNFQNEKQIKG